MPEIWAASVSTNAATFEAWIRTAVTDPQTIILGSNSPGATPRISVGGDQISVYWNADEDPVSPVRVNPLVRFGVPAIGGISTEAIAGELDAGRRWRKSLTNSAWTWTPCGGPRVMSCRSRTRRPLAQVAARRSSTYGGVLVLTSPCGRSSAAMTTRWQ
jgi:hypothetical protein